VSRECGGLEENFIFPAVIFLQNMVCKVASKVFIFNRIFNENLKIDKDYDCLFFPSITIHILLG
jgi:hypothetical protein